MDRETLEIVRAFVLESLDSLDEQEGKIQSITEANGKENIHSIFRVFHTIKGLSGFLNFHTINTVTHEAEALLDILRSKPEFINDSVIDLIYEGFDVLRTLLNTVASVMKDTGNEEAVKRLISRLQVAIQAIKVGQEVAKPVEVQSAASQNTTSQVQGSGSANKQENEADDIAFGSLDIDAMSEEELDAAMAKVFEEQNLLSQIPENSDDFFFSEAQLNALENGAEYPNGPNVAATHGTTLTGTFSQAGSETATVAGAASVQGTGGIGGGMASDMVQRYVTEALELVAVAEDGCLRLEQNPNDMAIVGTVFGAVHSLKGNSGFMGFPEIEGMSSDLENILDAVRSKTLEVYPGLISMLLTNIDIIKSAVQELAISQQASSGIKIEVKAEQKTALKIESQQVLIRENIPSVIPTIASENSASASIETEIFSKPTAVFYGNTTPTESLKVDHNSARHDKPKPPSNYDQNNTQAAQSVTHQFQTGAGSVSSREETAAKVSDAVGGSSAAPTLQRRDIRVDMDKLDKLFDLVGELITIESMVTNNPDVQALELENFNKAAGMLNKITRELQEVTMSIRMMPLEGLFSKMKRLVRDLSMRFDKKITLEISGAETEMDKNVIEEISDPLMHIIRNAIDHGIETKERRQAAGKNITGTIKLQARYEGNEILIIIEDDGGGINRAKVLEKAMNKGLLKTSPDKMSDREINALIFEPGFSTAEKVTDISGRGVGMDVVKRNIEKLQGSITVDTIEGKGSRFTLRIPLTLAIMDAMMLRVGQSVYALPILTIRESFRPHSDAITVTMDGLEVVKVRDELFSVIRLHEIYERQSDTESLTEGILVIVEARERKACLFVDEILGQQQIVVKGLSDYVGNVEGITGCMIQSNGEVGLIIDVDMLLQTFTGTATALTLG